MPLFQNETCSSVGKVTVDLIRRSWVRFPPRSKDISLPRVAPCFPLLGLTPSGLFMGLSSTLIYTSELILCSTICVPSATRHNIHIYENKFCMQFYFHVNQSHFHKNSFPLRLVLKQRHKGARKWPIHVGVSGYFHLTLLTGLAQLMGQIWSFIHIRKNER